jgi:hypothetical protein
MPRIRTIKPAFFKSLTIADLPIPCRLTFIGLWTYVDDAGRGMDDARLIKGEIWPLDDTYTVKKIEADLTLLTKARLIVRYEVDGKHYLVVTGWAEHQRINRPQPSRWPASMSDHTLSSEHSLNGQGKHSDESPNNHNQTSDGSVLEVEVEVEVESPQAPLREVTTAAVNNPQNPKSDGTSQQSENPPPTDPLAVRWLSIVANPHRPLTRLDTEKTINHLRQHLDPAVIDEIIGQCQNESDGPIHNTRYLLIAARKWATDHGQPRIPDIPNEQPVE